MDVSFTHSNKVLGPWLNVRDYAVLDYPVQGNHPWITPSTQSTTGNLFDQDIDVNHQPFPNWTFYTDSSGDTALAWQTGGDLGTDAELPDDIKHIGVEGTYGDLHITAAGHYAYRIRNQADSNHWLLR